MAKTLDEVDVVIVGTGWAGAIPAAELAKKGYKVVGLERGKDRETKDFIGAKDELRYENRNEMLQDLTKETLTLRNELDETAQPIRNGGPLGQDTGGTGVHWNGWSYRWKPYDFEIYSKTVEKYGKDRIPKDMTIQDWGITYDEMEPYYDRFEKTAGISGEDNPLGPWRSDDLPNPPLKRTPMHHLFRKATKELGYHPYPRPSANMSQKYENPDGETLNACVYCAFCEHYGCDFGAKAEPLTTVIPTALKTGNYEIRNYSYATRVLYENEKATGILYIDTETGKEYEQPAKLVVLAGFVFTNTRLLLLSEIGEPYNPNSGKGIIGKNYTGHFSNLQFSPSVIGFFKDKKFNLFAGAGALSETMDDFAGGNIDNTDLDFLHGFEIRIDQLGLRPINNNHVPKGTPSWGKEFKEESLFYTNRYLYLTQQGGSLPWKHNYMDLDPHYEDAFGDPLLRLTCKYTDQDRNLYKYAREKSKEIMEEMGADIIDVNEVTDETEFTEPTSHSGGGVIMGANPEESAVNNYSQMWEMDNLFVVGGSAYPHFSNYNPTETIGALAYRAAEGMIKYLENDGGLLIEPKKGK